MEKGCDNCGNLKFSIEAGARRCSMSPSEQDKCWVERGFYWIDTSEIETTINAEWLAEQTSQLVYRQCKGKLFAVLESQIESPQKLKASKQIAQDIITGISKDTASLIKDTLGDWEQEVIVGGELTPKEETEARKEHKGFEQAMK